MKFQKVGTKSITSDCPKLVFKATLQYLLNHLTKINQNTFLVLAIFLCLLIGWLAYTFNHYLLSGSTVFYFYLWTNCCAAKTILNNVRSQTHQIYKRKVKLNAPGARLHFQPAVVLFLYIFCQFYLCMYFMKIINLAKS